MVTEVDGVMTVHSPAVTFNSIKTITCINANCWYTLLVVSD